jgi:molybdate transport system ATP-binding protein
LSDLQVDFRVDSRDVELDVAVPAGGRLAVIGPNAAGKSTLLQVAAGLLVPDRGRVVLGGQTLTDTAAKVQMPAHRRRIGVMMQSGLLFGHMSVLDNVAFGPRSQRVNRAESLRRAHEWLERIGVSDLSRRKPGELSGGQQQRVALARTLAANPDALLLDEPTSALDVRVSAGLRGVLHEVTAGRTTVLVSHDLLDIVSIAEEVLVIEDGRVAERGRTTELLARPSSAFAARLADVNIIRGEFDGRETLNAGPLHITGRPDDGAASGTGIATLRPGSIMVSLAEPSTSARNVWPGQISTLLTMAHAVRIRVDVGGGIELAADVTPASAAELRLEPGARVWLSVKAQEVALSAIP